MFTIDYIKKDMGFSLPFIRKCLKELDSILKPHYKRGDSNQIMFTENGYTILDQIKQLKEQGLNIKAIKEHLDKQLKQNDKGEQEDIPCDQHTDINLLKKLFAEKELRLKERLEHQQRIFELEHLSQHQQRINELEKLSDHLKSQLLYITDGKSPEEYKSAWYQEQMDKQHLKGQLLYLTDGHTPEEVKQQWQQEQLEKQRIAWILKELENLDGIFSIVNYFKRKKLYKELQGLMTKQNTEPSNDASNAT